MTGKFTEYKRPCSILTAAIAMPGMSLYYSFAGISPSKRAIILDTESDRNNQDSVSTVLLDNKRYILKCDGYKEYPVASFETEDYRIFLEGCIYGEDDAAIESALTMVADNLVENDHACGHERIRPWLLTADGEFIVLILHKRTDAVYIVTDALGRLPLYYSKDCNSIILSRHIDLVAKLRESAGYNRMAVAQYLLFAYSLGATTLVHNVYRLSPCSVIKIDPIASLIDIQPLYTFCFSEKLHSHKNLETNATELANLLSTACLNRTKSNPCNVLSLSGGLDSRTVAACIRKIGIQLSAVTMIDADGALMADANVAEQVAGVLGMEWKVFKLQAPKGKDVHKLLSIKTGLNYLAMSFIIQFLDRLRNTYGSGMNYITGDGGDKVLIDLRPQRSLRSLSDLVQYILSHHQIFSLEAVSRMTGMTERAIIDGITEHVGSYPEEDWGGKYVHFVLFERAFRWLFEGEDRNRSFFRHLAPFYGIQFFRYVMNCPDDQKVNHRLYKELLLRLSPEVSNINNANWGFPITSKRYYGMVATQSLRGLIPVQFKKRLKQLGKDGIPSRYKECVGKQITGCDVLGNSLIYPEVMRQLDRCTKREAQTLLTVTSAVEQLACGRSTIREYWEDQF